MGESVRVAEKKPVVKNQKSVYNVPKASPSQSRSHAVERILFLQRTIGNQGVRRLIESGSLQELQVSKSILRKCPLCTGINGNREKKKKEDELFNIREIKDHTPKSKAGFNATSVSGKHMTRSGMAFLEKDETAADDTEVDPRFLYQNGITTCTFPAGTPSTVIYNAGCSGTCTSRHEAVHASDIGPCCAKAGAAHAAAATPAAKTAVENQFFTWMSSNRSWFECRAYAESVRCADEEINKKKCNIPPPADPACCNELAAYRTDKEARRVSNCAAAGALSPCPFP
jgi:hypothetical protein